MTDTKPLATKAAGRGAGIREVARRSGVSIATVSRALSGGEAVSPATRERIVKMARALDYQPSPLGRNLVRGRSSLIGLIVPNVSFPLYGEMIRGIEDVLSGHGMSALLASSHDDTHTELASARRILGHAVDGGIVINSLLGAALPVQRGLNWVQVSPETPNLPCRVELDNEAGGWRRKNCCGWGGVSWLTWLRRAARAWSASAALRWNCAARTWITTT